MAHPFRLDRFRRSAKRLVHRTLAAGTALFLALAASCSESTSDEPPPPADTLARERAAAAFLKGQKDVARTELAPLATRANAALEDLIHAAAIELAAGETETCRFYLDRAQKVDASSPALNYLRGQLALEVSDYEAARKCFGAAHASVPGDLATRLMLAQSESELGNLARAEELYKSVIDVGIENGQGWYVVAVYRLARLLTENKRDAEAEPYNARFLELSKQSLKPPGQEVILLGTLARVSPPAPRGTSVEKPRGLQPFRAEAKSIETLAKAQRLSADDLDGDVRPDLWAVCPDGVRAAFWRKEGWSPVTVSEPAANLARAFDLDNDNDLDFLIIRGNEASLAIADQGQWSRSPLVLPSLPSPPADIVAVDFDHEGDLDLLLVGRFGARLWRNDGAVLPDKGGKFEDVTKFAGLPEDKRFDWCLTEDFDSDNDVDFLLGGSESLFLADSLRAGKFADTTAKLFDAGARIAKRPVAADWNGDARPDLWAADALWLQQKTGRMTKVAHKERLAIESDQLTAVDLDLDGSLDLIGATSAGATTAGACTALLAAGTDQALSVSATADPATPIRSPLCAADFDADRDLDLAFSDERGAHILDGTPSAPPNHGVLLSFGGLRDNRRAVGSIVEVRAGGMYRRIYWRGEPVVVGVGQHEKLDVRRITWPNGAVQTEIDLDLNPRVGIDDPGAAFESIMQPSGLVGSCPFLYTWNGTRNEFISDVLGGTPLGLPIAPGVLVPPDHDEFVLVRGDQLRAKDERFELHLTEELREVTYLDHAKLIAVDHPRGTEVQPNERFSFPPFPEAHIHCVNAPIAPRKATGSGGQDWTRVLASIDDEHAHGFELEPPQFAGLAKPWYVELEFDPQSLTEGARLRLFMTGWFSWSDASANMASARQPGIQFIPPILQVPDGDGGWKDSGPPVGFPAGKTKTMVIDVTGILRRDDPRLRVATTLCLFWDAVRLGVGSRDDEVRTHELGVQSANVWRRGFSAPLAAIAPGEADDARRPERFDWNRLAREPRWNQHPGMYTRYGDTTPLCRAIDDQFVILGAGDALTLTFDATKFPPVPSGSVRDYLVFLDGWAKDRDPNTIEALEVEPLPFHAMSGYPYRSDEKFPDDEVHRRWRAEWNTRRGFDWIRPISPARAAEELSGE